MSKWKIRELIISGFDTVDVNSKERHSTSMRIIAVFGTWKEWPFCVFCFRIFSNWICILLIERI